LNSGTFASYKLQIGGTDVSATTNAVGASATPLIYNTSGTQYTSNILPNPARLQTSLSILSGITPYTSSANNLSLYAIPTNLQATGVGTVTAFTYTSKNFYIDLASIAVMTNESVAITRRGVRYLSYGGSEIPTNVTTTFDNTQDLSSGATNYQYELQLVNGAYITKQYATNNSGYDGYRNYESVYFGNTLNYTGINTSGIRYAMFRWTGAAGAGTRTQVQFTLTYAPSGTFPVDGSALNNFTNGIRFIYKVVNNSDGSKTTGWLDGNVDTGHNAADPNTGTSFASSYTINGQGGLLASTATVRNLQIASGLYGSYDIYVRIGIPMNQSYAFSGIFFNSIT
jgi:hypothetical protein